MAAYQAFRKPSLIDQPDQADTFGDVAARRSRYALLWAMFGASAYDNAQAWTRQYKTAYDLYDNTRAIYNPSARLGTFYEMYLLGGSLSSAEGQGAIPLVGGSDELYTAVDRLWRDSNWSVNKDVLALWGTILGDAALEVVPDLSRGKIYLRLLHPSRLEDVVLDSYGHVKSFTESYDRSDDLTDGKTATYTRRVSRDGDLVVTETYKNSAPYAWPEHVDEDGQPMSGWEEPWGFVPLVTIQHRNVGGDWGWSELQPSLEKFREVDEQASLISDAVRKQQNQALFAPGASSDQPITLRNERNTTPILYHPNPNQRLEPVEIPLNIGAAIQHLTGLLGRLEGDFPELEFEKTRLSGQVSGVALEVAQAPAVTKIRQRRVGYDAALVRAHQMALAIGGELDFDGYEEFDLNSYDAGDLEHRIGERDVFETSRTQQAENERIFWEGMRAASFSSGIDEYLRRAGYSDEEIASFNNAPERRAMITRATLLSGGASG
jgi:hypothetical protein